MWPFHRHDWRTVQARRATGFVFVRGVRIDTGDLTEALQRCDCGRLRTEQFTGHWTLAELTGGTS